MVQWLYITFWQILIKFNKYLSYDPTIPRVIEYVYPTRIPMADLFIIAKKTSENNSTVQSMDYYWTLKGKRLFNPCYMQCHGQILKTYSWVKEDICTVLLYISCVHEHLVIPVSLWPHELWPPDSSMEFSRQDYWRRLLFPSLGNLPNPGIEPASLVSPTLAGGFLTLWATGETLLHL